MKEKTVFRRHALALGMTSILTAISLNGYADLNKGFDKVELDIDTQRTDAALLQLAKDSGVHIIFSSQIAQQSQSPAVQGLLTINGALDQLLTGTDLTYKIRDNNVVLVTEKNDEEESEDSAEKDDQVDEEIIVTGSRIARTPSQMAANIIVLDNKALMASGETTLEGALRQLPQNIFGATPIGASVGSSGMSFNGALNITGASSINLRGLGSESTLILVDGKRIGKSGVFGGVSDITGIPLRMVEQVEIMLDGGSSIYGSDAVGGVVNVITRKDFEGGEATYEYGTSELGGFSEHVLSVSASTAWDTGRVYATFERFQRSNLDGAERPEKITNTVGATTPGNLSPRSFFQFFYRYDGEVVTLSELLPFYSFSEILFMIGDELIHQDVFLPPNQDGTNLSIDDLVFADSVTRLDDGRGISIQPKQTRNTLDVGFDQELKLFGQELMLSGSLYYSERNTYAANGEFVFAGLLPADYPTNPLPGQAITVAWNMPGWADKHYETDQKVAHWNLSLDGNVGDGWRWSVAAGQSRDDAYSLYFNEAIDPYLQEFQDLLNDGLNILASDLFAANPPELLERLISPPQDTIAINTENTFEFNANGGLVSLPGGDIHMSVGVAWRQEGLESGSRKDVIQGSGHENEIGNVFSQSLPRVYENIEISRTQRSSFAELLVPVVGANNALPGIQQLNLTGTARYDSYQRQGSDSTWSLGMIWNPIDQVTVRVRSSTSYVVPTFRDQLIPTRITDWTEFYGPLGLAYPLADRDGNLTGEFDYQKIQISGGNPDLEPETSGTLTAKIEITPDMFPGLTLSANWYQTDYNNRIGPTPTIRENFSIPFVGSSFLAGSDYDTKYGSTLYRDEDGFLVWDRRVVNTAYVEASGIDYGLRYNRETDYGHFIATANVYHTRKYNTVKQIGDAPINQVEDVGFSSRSVIPAYRYHAQLLWSYRGLSASLNASTSSKTKSVSDGEFRVVQRITKPPLRMDMTVTYDVDEGDLFAVPGWLQGTTISLKIPRLLNQVSESETIDLATGEPYVFAGFNSNTADPIGRMFRISLTKRF